MYLLDHSRETSFLDLYTTNYVLALVSPRLLLSFMFHNGSCALVRHTHLSLYPFIPRQSHDVSRCHLLVGLCRH